MGTSPFRFPFPYPAVVVALFPNPYSLIPIRYYLFLSSTFPFTVDSLSFGPPFPIAARNRRGSIRPLIVTGKSI